MDFEKMCEMLDQLNADMVKEIEDTNSNVEKEAENGNEKAQTIMSHTTERERKDMILENMQRKIKKQLPNHPLK